MEESRAANARLTQRVTEMILSFVVQE